jgi:16S rRNA (uracil1498-N3)-methyltransferase
MAHEVFCFIDDTAVHGAALRIGGAVFHHLARVRRVRVGDALAAALPDGRLLRAVITALGADALEARVTEACPPAGVSPCAVTLYQAVLKGDRMEQVVQKACELGAHALVPLLARRSVPRWTPDQAAERAERWQRIAEAAAAQCERSVPLRVHAPVSLDAALAEPLPLALLLHERDGVPLPTLAARQPSAARVALFLGPEGGWDDAETARLRAAGVHPVHLGGRILRAETATLTALALVQYVWGDLG